MNNNSEILSKPVQIPDESITETRKPYLKPALNKLGDLRTFTLGHSTGTDLESPINGLEYWTPQN